MRRMLSVFGVLILALTLCVVSNGSASALGGEQLDCRVLAGGSLPGFEPGSCAAESPASVYEMVFLIDGDTTGDTFTWSKPADSTIFEGCGSGDAGCALDVNATHSDRDEIVSVVLNQGGSTETLTADAFLPATCGNFFC